MHNTRHKLEAFIDVCDISIRYRDSTDRIVITQGRPRERQPVSGKNDVCVDHGDHPAMCHFNTLAPGVTAALILLEFNELYTRILCGYIRDYLGRAVA